MKLGPKFYAVGVTIQTPILIAVFVWCWWMGTNVYFSLLGIVWTVSSLVGTWVEYLWGGGRLYNFCVSVSLLAMAAMIIWVIRWQLYLKEMEQYLQ